jgi:hypothetical protein
VHREKGRSGTRVGPPSERVADTAAEGEVGADRTIVRQENARRRDAEPGFYFVGDRLLVYFARRVVSTVALHARIDGASVAGEIGCRQDDEVLLSRQTEPVSFGVRLAESRLADVTGAALAIGLAFGPRGARAGGFGAVLVDARSRLALSVEATRGAGAPLGRPASRKIGRTLGRLGCGAPRQGAGPAVAGLRRRS